MNKLVTLMMLCSSGPMPLSGAEGAPQGNPPAIEAGQKIAFVNTLEVLSATEEGKLGIGEVEQLITQRKQQYEDQKEELDKLQEQFTNQQLMLTPEGRAEMQRGIEGRQRKLQRFQEDSSVEIDRRRQQLLGRMSAKIQEIIIEYAQQKNFAVVFQRDQSQPYVSPGLDITQEIVEIYNRRHPLARAPTPAPSSPAPPQQ
jgi:outer membrane protein